MNNSYKLMLKDLTQEFNTNLTTGLSKVEAEQRLKVNGLNELVEQAMKSPWRILWEQLTATMVLILIFAAIISAFLGDYKDAIAIIAIVILNALLGFSQEFKAEKAIVALRKLSVPNVKARRDNQIQDISSRELVVGDIILIETGNIIPADCRLIESPNLAIQESTLTGESDAVEKDAHFITDKDLSLGDRKNVVYMGTVVTYGRGQAVVTATGMKTELGNIAKMIQSIEQEPTPLQKRLDQVGKSLIIAIVILVAIIFILGLIRGESVQLMLLMGVSLAVAAIPEALPAVVTITLALGAQRMLKRQALIRKLPAVETLGSITVICSDKTGTLTENRMTVTTLSVLGQHLDLTKPIDNAIEHPAFKLLLLGGTLCTDATLTTNANNNKENITAIGDPTENALVVIAAKQNLFKPEIEQFLPRVAEQPFDSERKRMTTIHQFKELKETASQAIVNLSPLKTLRVEYPYIAFSKGAVDNLLQVTDRILVGEKIEPLTDKYREQIIATHNQITQSGKRVLGVAFRPLKSLDIANIEDKLIFIGMMGMFDPTRPEVKGAIETCKLAGIRPIIITGDHPLIAQYVADDLSITTNTILTGQELDKLSLDELTKTVSKVSIYARVVPEHKLKIVEALQKNGQIVAMTGDGVNDAPALKKADIGVSMGISGTDVAREASDVVLLNDNFATIISAVEEGRVIYDNIKKYIKQTLTGNLAAIWVTLIAPIIGMPLPLLPLQLLWLNLVADGLPSVALGLEGAEHNVMQRPPNNPNESIFNSKKVIQILWGGTLIGTVLLVVGYWYWSKENPAWQTMVLTTIIFSRMSLIMAIRSNKDSLFTIGVFSNKALLAAISLTVLAQLTIIYVPFLQTFFGTVALSFIDLMVSFGLSLIIFVAIEIEKWITRANEVKHHKYSLPNQRYIRL